MLAGQALARDRRPRAAGGGDDSFGAGVTIVNQAAAGPGARALRGPSEETLLLFARAVQQLHTYPPASPLCRQAIAAWHRLLSGSAQREPLDFRVAPAELTIDEVAVGRGTVIETELARRLHAAGIAQVTIERHASPRELTHLCLDLLSCSDRRHQHLDLIELLAEHGVSRITLRPAYRPEVMPVDPPSQPLAALVDEQRARREAMFASGGPINHLYPPDKGWVRLDPSTRFASVSLVDLALLVDNPASLAAMLLRLTDDQDSATSPHDALSQKFSDVATLFAALDPSVARVMFSRLAHAVLDLDPGRRQNLLRRTILPGLLDGRMEGEVLRDFPNLDLADSLCLLLDLETAAPEVVTTALAKLDLSPERHNAVLPLIRERLQTRAGHARETSLDAHARKLTAIDGAQSRSYAEFAAFDLALDEHALDALIRIRDAIVSTDVASDQIACLWNLVRLEANPDLAARFMTRAVAAIDRLDAEGRWAHFGYWIGRFADLGAALRSTRPDVSDVIVPRMAEFNSVARAARLIELAARGDEGRAAAGAIITALGPAIGPPLAIASTTRGPEGREVMSRSGQQLLGEHAPLLAPAVAEALHTAAPSVARALIRMLSIAGAGYEPMVATQLRSADEQTGREALRCLARIGTARAAALVRGAVDSATTWLSGAAVDTLWQFPPAVARKQVLELLSHRMFVLQHPALAARLLDRAAQLGPDGLPPVLATLVPLRYRVWSPALARVGRRAHALLRS